RWSGPGAMLARSSPSGPQDTGPRGAPLNQSATCLANRGLAWVNKRSRCSLPPDGWGPAGQRRHTVVAVEAQQGQLPRRPARALAGLEVLDEVQRAGRPAALLDLLRRQGRPERGTLRSAAGGLRGAAGGRGAADFLPPAGSARAGP